MTYAVATTSQRVRTAKKLSLRMRAHARYAFRRILDWVESGTTTAAKSLETLTLIPILSTARRCQHATQVRKCHRLSANKRNFLHGENCRLGWRRQKTWAILHTAGLEQRTHACTHVLKFNTPFLHTGDNKMSAIIDTCLFIRTLAHPPVHPLTH